ncbi:hypothetical protein OG985_48990 (plasmid) [Streptomyces sp. NBC_00289]|uniref:hypothetical protein n=1 Tax=Streptomyces sp. NBC_00289 TaxID=2975703 RepID=UPI002F90680C
MSDQHAATTLTAAAVIATTLVARAVLHQGSRRPAARPPRRRSTPRADQTAPYPAALSDDASYAVREAEQHVHHYWQQLRTRADPPE